MKTSQVLPAILIAAIALGLMSGCASSSANVVALNITPQPAAVIEVMPTSAAKERYGTLDKRDQFWYWVDGRLEKHWASDARVYTFDDKDYANLRASVIESLRQGRAFKEVRDATPPGNAGSSIRLYIDFVESGMGSTGWMGGFTCRVRALAWTEDPTGKVLAKREIVAEGKSEMTVSIAKNEVITKFVQEVSKLFVTN